MARRAIPFTGSGALELPDQDNTLVGAAFIGFTSVEIYDGQDDTGVLVAASVVSGGDTIHLSEPVRLEAGIYVKVAGTGKGSIHI